jgi:two-component sensor histidine kinase
MKTLTPALLRASARSWVSSDLQRVGPYWLQWVWTLLFSAVLAVGFTALGYVLFGHRGPMRSLDGVLTWYVKNLVVCLTVAGVIHLMFDGLGHLVGGAAAMKHWKDWQRSLFFGGVPIVGVALGWPLGVTLAGGDVLRWVSGENGRSVVMLSLSTSLVLTFFFHHWFSAKARQYHAEQRATEAQLKLLQAQIEPHFLFNTLANVQSLMDHDLPRARQMLASFTDYLRASLGALRRDDSAVADELELARSYLELLQARMDDRLRFDIDADESARRQPLPPLLLQPLVENAVVHGLEPSIDGGRVSVTARVRGERLVLEVRDDGRGPEAPPATARRGNGVALQNIRERLAARYGDAARLSIEPAHPGTRACIELPLAGGRA